MCVHSRRRNITHREGSEEKTSVVAVFVVACARALRFYGVKKEREEERERRERDAGEEERREELSSESESLKRAKCVQRAYVSSTRFFSPRVRCTEGPRLFSVVAVNVPSALLFYFAKLPSTRANDAVSSCAAARSQRAESCC